jgi:hypothetical protein
MSTAERKQDLDRIEKKIAELIAGKTGSWKVSYKLIKQVENEKMWKERDCRSFSEWVRIFSHEYATSEAFIWKIRAAGDAYIHYTQSVGMCGSDSLFQCRLAMDAIIDLNKMSRGNPDATQRLIAFAERNGVTRRESRNAWSRTKMLMEKAGITAAKTNGHGQYEEAPDGISPFEILRETVIGRPESLSDRDIAGIVRKYLGANVRRSVLEGILKEYAERL